MAAKIFRINYKSDFILTLNSDAGWMTPFCIKFWTGAPSQAFFVGWDGTTYTHCSYDPSEPTKLVVQFDDHHLPIGDLKFQIAYHFTVADFPNDTEDEVINPASITTEIDGQEYQVMLDFNGETAPEIQFALPAYANEAQRIANEEARIAAEQQRIANEDARIQAEETRQYNEQQRIQHEEYRVSEFARLKSESEAATDAANTAATLANEKAQLAADKAALADAAATLANEKAQLAADKSELAQAAATLANEKAALAQQKAEYAQTQGDYAKVQGDYAKAQGDTAQADHVRAEADHTTAADDHSRAEGDHTTAASDHSRAESDHTTAASDHSRAESDHTTAASDHTRAESDHTTAASDHTRAESDHTTAASDHETAASDHTRAESDHAAVEVYVDSLGAFDISSYHATGGELAKYANLTAALGTDGANIPEGIRKGGMSVKFVQSSVLSVGSKYIQARCMAQSFTTDVTQWQGVESGIIPNSPNLIESRGVVNAFSELTSIIKLNKTYSASNVQPLITNIFIPTGTKIYVKVTSNDAVWSRFAIFGNNSAWTGQWRIDNIANGVERSLVAPVNITNIYGYLISATTYGTLNITIRWANSLVVTEANIEANSISSSKIQDNAISTSKMADDSISTEKINNNAITTPKISDNAVVTGKIKDKQITKEKVSFIYSKNLVDINALNLGKYLNNNGVLVDNSSYNTTDYLPVSAGTTYYCANRGVSTNARFVAFYTENKSNISAAFINTYVNNFVCPENAAFARVTFQSLALHLQIESSPITEYHPYKELIDSNLLPDAVIPDGAVSTSKLENGAVTQDKIAEGVSFAPTPPKFKGFSVSNNALANGDQLHTSTVKVPKQVNLTAIIKGTITSVLVGIAKGDFYGEYVEITSTQVKVYKGTSTTPSDTYNHGLTLTNNTVISIIKGNESGATVKLITDKGDIFSQQIGWLGIVGKAFVENNNGSGTIDVKLSFFLKDITKKVWLFGDSYYNIYDNKRWPWYLVSWGFTNYLIDAKGGQSAAPALSDFQNLLSLGSRPSFVLWGLGMNAGSDENNTVNATWLANTQSFLALCEQYSITPILATIPTVPSGAHAKLNEWVRNSGYRYIDFAAAVETSGSNHWKYWDTDDALLSSDEVHPTAKGAAVLASQAILDFQEMTLAAD